MLKKLFTNDTFFLATAICTVLAGIMCAIFTMISWGLTLTDFFIIVIRVSCGIVLYIAYQKHEKNVMKGMMGALLMIQLLGCILNFTLFGIDSPVFSAVYIESSIYSGILLILTTALFINHFIINSDHHSSPRMIYINQILAIAIILFNAFWNFRGICVYPNWQNIVTSILDAFAYGGVLCIIVCVESRLDAYRIDRETAGWTEEKGYPEGYVHQKDR